jgi:nucleoside-diphosphate-sugar epimerase
MRVMVAGASSAVGRRLVPLLVEAGHTVTGLTRSAIKAEALRAAGADAFAANARDPSALRAATLGVRPEVVIHEMTAISNASDMRRFYRAFAMTNRLRTEALDHLLAAAREVGAHRVIAQSYCGWPYARIGEPVKSEEDTLDSSPPSEQRNALKAIRHLEASVAGASEFSGIVLRYGSFYGRDTGLFEGPIVAQVRRRLVPLIGDADGWWSFLHVDDAAAATAAAVERGESGVYNIVDDDPAPVRDWLPALASMLGAKPPRRIPRWLARLFVPEHIVTMMTEIRAGSNLKARSELGWRPAHPS